MTNEQREAAEFLEFYKQHCLKKEIENMDNYETIHDGDFVSKNLDTVLALIKEQQEELDKKDKQIDLMARAFKQDDVRTVEEIKQYFENKVDSSEQLERKAKMNIAKYKIISKYCTIHNTQRKKLSILVERNRNDSRRSNKRTKRFYSKKISYI